MLELDDFLLSREKYYSKYGDMVFYEKVNLQAVDVLNEARIKNEKEAKAWNEAKKAYAGDEELIKLNRPFVGVTEFLSGQRNTLTGELYFPEFRENEYWDHRYNAWTNAKKATKKDNSDGFTQDEIDLFFNGKESEITAIPLGDPNTWKNSKGEYIENFGSDEQNTLRKQMQTKWEKQAQYGTELHNVIEKYFSKTSNGNNWSDLLEGPQGNFQLSNFIDNLRKSNRISDITTDQKVKEVLEYAKQLKQEIVTKYGSGKAENITFFPEFTLSAKLNKQFEGKDGMTIVGRVDLLFLDEKGYPHVVDYKTSPKTYEDYNSAKKLGFTYQLATYKRMLSRLGLRTEATDLIVAPIQMENFHWAGDKWDYDKVVKGTSTTYLLKNLDADKDYINENLDDYIEAPLVVGGDPDKIIEKVTKGFEKWFPNYGNDQIKTDEEIRDLIDKQGGFKVNSETGKYEFTPKGWSKPFIADSEADLFIQIKKLYTGTKEKNIKKTAQIKKAIIYAKQQNLKRIELGNNTDDWVRYKLSKYLGDNWEIWDNPAAEAAQQFGMILFHNKELNVLEVVKISNRNLKYLNNWGNNRTNLTGAHEIDLKEDSKSGSLMLKAANGNIELMEAMLVLNNLNIEGQIQLGRIDVVSPFSTAQGLSASNKELKYCWDKLQKLNSLDEEDKFKSGKIKMLTKAEACYIEFKEIMSRVGDKSDYLSSEISGFKSAVNELHKSMSINNIDETLALLHQLREKLEKNDHMSILKKDVEKKKSVHLGLRNYDDDYERILYQYVQSAILELTRLDVRQSLSDHEKYLESVNIIRKGMSGSMLDNPGHFRNSLLNQVTSLALEGYQNARDMASRRLIELRLKTEELKKKTGFSGLLEHTVGNQASLYNGMTEYIDGDLRFINPWKNNNLHPDKAEYLKYIILELNKNLHPTWSEAQIQQKINDNDVEFFQVPLIEASFASKVNSEGWLGWFKNKCKRLSRVFSSKESFKKALEDFQSNYLSDEEEQLHKSDTEIFKTTNLMDQGNGPRRKQIIADKISRFGEGFFERDLESILSSHIWAYSTQEALEDRMPLLKAAYISMAIMGNEQNYEFEKDAEFFQQFVANKINQQSIVDEKLKYAKGALGVVQKAASWMALAFSPLQFTYQSMEGIWKSCKLIVTKPDGTLTFTSKNMWNAARIVYRELFHSSDVPSVTSAVNSQYGINDMDNVAFAENNTSNRHGIFNFFGKFAYKFSSRPDFYNRMTIFVAQMKHDGSWEAHSVDKKTGELIYNEKKDKRFVAYTNDKEGKNGQTEEWLKAKALYFATATQLVTEGARNKDGSLFKVGQPLPKAYSNKESEAKKAVGDSMYGYYDSTKKSLFQSVFLGGLMMQMRTYWSSKKNQYLQPGGVKNQGQWVQAEEEIIDPETNKVTKQKLYYSKLDSGEIDRNGPLVGKDDPRCSKVPFMQWKGKFEEGVIATVSNALVEAGGALAKGSISDSWNVLKNTYCYNENVDPELTKAYRSNINLLISDLFIWWFIGSIIGGMIGDWADDEEKEAKKSGHMDDAMMATFAQLCAKTVKNSSLDAAWWSSIFDVSMDWNPFAISYLGNEVKTLWNFATGDQSASETLIKSMSAARQMRPILRCLDTEE